MDSSHHPSVRVLTRPPPGPLPVPTSTPVSSSTTAPPLPPSQPLSHDDGVVVVGFISRRPDFSSQLINRILDSNIFGSGNRDKVFSVDEEVKDWFKFRRISYYHDEAKGILYLQFCSTRCPVFGGNSDPGLGFDSVVEEHEFGDLQGLLFMFSVCHVVIFLQEGSRLDTQILRNLRLLQAAKHGLAPYVRSRTTPALPSRPHSLQGRSGGILSHNSSSLSLISGVGSSVSLVPGQCTPVTLFAFVDDFSDIRSSSCNMEESTDTSSHNQSSHLPRSALPMKGSGSVVVLARPESKSEGGLRKKLQSSLEGQVRFLIKKCRILSGSEGSYGGSRSGGFLNSVPLFSFDSSRAVVLLNRSTNQNGESLNFATRLVEDVLNGKATPDSLLLECHDQSGDHEDFLCVKDFIYKQNDILRGRGGSIANTNSAGMVAVAAAVAAASTSSSKSFSTPELPHMETWLSSSQLILLGVLTAEGGIIPATEAENRKLRLRNVTPAEVEGNSSKVANPIGIAVSWLESGKGLNTKFSIAWCEKSLPAAKDVYMKNLPACYPTSVHEARLEAALFAFNSMVRGPAVLPFSKRLKDECTSIWKSGRQLCDAVSLTGRPCMHQRHDVETGETVLGDVINLHSSGYVFLHACSCGRSRKLRSDPFDYESANISFNCFPDCDKLLPSIQVPLLNHSGPIKPSSWSLIRLGGARYYESSKGLLQSGFCASQKFLSKWIICVENQNSPNGLLAQKESVNRSKTDLKIVANRGLDTSKAGAKQLPWGDVQTGGVNRRKPLNGSIIENRISFGNFSMKKPFSEVVAESASKDSAFPPLQHSKQLPTGHEKSMKPNWPKDRTLEQVHAIADQGSKKPEIISSRQETNNGRVDGCMNVDSVLCIGSTVVSKNTIDAEKTRSDLTLKHVTAYIGFEHECPHGHRFLLSIEHLSQLGSSYSILEEFNGSSSTETSNNTLDPSKLNKNTSYSKGHRKSNKMASVANKKYIDKPKQIMLKGIPYKDELLEQLGTGEEHNQTSTGTETIHIVKNLEKHLHSINVDEGGHAFSLLNSNLPIFMNCPHCKSAKKDLSTVKFAGTISQLQRIFLVTPPFPLVLATCPVIQFQESCLPLSVSNGEQKLRYSLGCPVILPPESFLTLRLPFVYGVQLDDKSLFPLNPSKQEPEATAWIVKGSTLQVVSKESNLNEKFQT